MAVAAILHAALAGAGAQSLAERAEGGNPAAQFELATRYDLGNGVPADAEIAFTWFRRAAEDGLPEAEFNVAVMLDSGRGIAQNKADAALWYARSAARGNHRAQFNLGLQYAAGDGVPRNPDLAALWVRQASPGIPEASRRLAVLRPVGSVGAVAAATLTVPRGRVAPGQAPIEFAWTAPAQPEPARYLIEVCALDRAGSWEVYSATTHGSATVAPLRKIPGTYAWKVFTLVPLAAQCKASDWVFYTIPPASEP